MFLAVDERGHQVAMIVGQQRQRKHVIYAKLPHRQILYQTHSPGLHQHAIARIAPSNFSRPEQQRSATDDQRHTVLTL